MPDEDTPVSATPDGAPPERTEHEECTEHQQSGIDLARSALAAARAAARARDTEDRRRGTRGARQAARDAAQRRSGAHPEDRDPQLLGRAIDWLLEDRGWQEAAAVAGAVGRWAQIVGPDIAAHCSADAFRDGVLHVSADSTAWATELRLLAPVVLKRLGAELGHGTVTRISVHGPGAPSWRHGGRSVPGRGPRDTYG